MSLRPVVLTAFLAVCCNLAFAQYAGQNINMVSGTSWPAGDPYLQRQNEPSMAVSSRNPEHLMGGANDYRTVDIPNPGATNILGDAWLGVYTSLDGGETWKSTLLPGYPQDTSSVGTSSPLHAFTVATDPTVRAGTNGMFYYSGLVFDRGSSAPSGVFVATFQDQDNKGNGDAAILAKSANGTNHGNPFAYIGASLIDSGTSGQFLDKPWIVVDIPRPGRTATCKVNGQTFSSGYVYIVYTQFNGSQNNPSSKIKEVTSTNCGVSWSNPQILSQSQKLAQGTVAAIDPNNGNVYVAWRQIAIAGNQNQPDAMQWAISTNGGYSFTYEPAAFTFAAPTSKNLYPAGSVFDQPQASPTNFRSLDVPTLAVDGNSRVWMAFSERVNGPNGTYGSRIMITTLPKGSMTWTTPIVADSSAPSTSYGNQFMPSLNFAYGKMALAWFDSRRDNLENELQCPTGTTCTGLSDLISVDVPIPGSSISNPSTIFTPLMSDPTNGIRHTIDVYGGIIDPSSGPKQFAGFQVSQYGYWVDPGDNQIKQGFFNAPNLPMFVTGTQPFIGDYIDIASQNIIPSGNSWAFNTQGTDATGATNAPDFHFTWTDNRDVVPPPVVSGAENWALYVPPNSGASRTSTYSGTGNACPTCSTTQPACTPVQDDNGAPSAYSGDRNQNVYTSRITNGLVVRFRENSKPLSKSISRSFSLLIKNTVPPLKALPLGSPSYYRILLGTTSTSNAPSCTITGGTASLQPTTPNCYLDVAINPGTTLTQAITLNSTSATAGLNVLVAQIPSIGSANYSGLQALAFINGDPTNPSVADPDFTVADDSNPDVATPYGNLPIATGEEYDPTVGGPLTANASNTGVLVDVGSASVTQPGTGTNTANNAPMVTVNTPRINTPRITSEQVVNPQIVNAINTPRINTPRINTPRIVSPDIFTPRITDLSDGGSQVTDYTWSVNNKGNTTASYKTQELVKAAGVTCCPAGSNGPNCSVCQLMQQKVYESPTPSRESTNGNPSCDLNIQQSYTTVANISDPSFTSGVAGGSPSDPTSSTLSLSPGEGNRVTLRVKAPPVTQTISSFKTQACSFLPDSNGSSGCSLGITTGVLPVAVVGQNYTNTTLTSVGGFGSTVWTVPSDITNPVAVEPPPAPNSSEALPVSPLTLSPSGQISTSKVTAATGTYPVNVQVQDSAVSGTGAGTSPNPALDVQQLQLEVNQFKIGTVTVTPTSGEDGTLVGTLFMRATDTANVAVTINSDGPANATNVVPTLTVNPILGGTQNPAGSGPVVNCTGPVPPSATIFGTGAQQFNFTCTATSGNGYITFTANATGHYVNAAADVLASAGPVYEPQMTPGPSTPNIIVDTVKPTVTTFSGANPSSNQYGWNNTNVTFSYTTSDNLAGVQTTVPNPLLLSTEGRNVTGQVTVTDYANNSATFTSPTNPQINIDKTPPTITPSSTYAPNTWTNQNVIVQFTCADNLSGPFISGGVTNPIISGIPAAGATLTYSQQGALTSIATVTLTAETQGTTLTANCQDFAGNNAIQAQFGPIKIDKTPPALSATAVAGLNQYTAGAWTNQNVTVTFACVDDLSAVANSGVSSFAPLQQIFNTETSNGSSTGTCTDQAGNVSSVTFSPIMIDKTPPVLTVSASTPLGAYTSGAWTNQNVSVTYVCVDNASTVNSGVAAGSPTGSQTFTQQTTIAGVNASGSCTDQAGNVATNAPLSFGPVKIDTTPPTVTGTATAGGSTYHAGDWTNQPVIVTFACSDPLSGPDNTSITGDITISTQQSTTANGTCKDVAGNLGTGSFGPINIDITGPAITVSTPSPNQQFILNSTITPGFSCMEGTGGIDTDAKCTATPSASPYAASPIGAGTFNVSATDQAGNSATTGNIPYLVVYNFTGFQAPLSAATASTAAVQSDSGGFMIGTTILVAWQLQDANNSYITDPTTATSLVAIPNAACTGMANGTGTSIGGITYDPPNNRFVSNWNTTGLAVGCYNLVLTTNDTLQWSTLVHLGQTYAVGNAPFAAAFDGTNMWIANYGDNTVTELNASTGAVVSTVPVGQGPDGVLFDGANIWVANTTDNTVTKLSPSGTVIGTFAVGAQPWGLAFDGTNIWVTNRGSATVTELVASTGTVVGNYSAGAGPYGITFDGTNMWVADDYTSSVRKLSPNGTVLGDFSVGSSPVGVTFDGTNIWVADQTSGVGTVTKLSLSGSVIGTYPAGPAPNTLLSDGTNIWVTDNGSNTVTKLSASTGATLGTFAIGTNPYGIAFDGTNIWVTVPGNNSVTELPAK